eukprot:c25538_g1_i1 orf=334-1701(-)
MGSQTLVPKQEEPAALISPNTSAALLCVPSIGGKRSLSLARQLSIYSLTLNEFQNALGESGKSFGSMNMDEFLRNIWTAEESQAMAAAMTGDGCIGKQHSLQRQGSLSLPRTLSRKTVDEVWKEINRETDVGPNVPSGQQTQPTFGEMTLEDFLVRAGVVREDSNLGQFLSPFGASLEGVDQLTGNNFSFGERASRGLDGGKQVGLPTLSLGAGNVTDQVTLEGMQLDSFKHMSPASQQTDWVTNQYRNAVVQQQQQQQFLHQQPVEAYGNVTKRVGNGALVDPAIGGGLGRLGHMGGALVGGVVGTGLGGGYGTGLGHTTLGYGIGSPSSPLSDGVGPSYGDASTLSPVPYGLDVMRGRKRGYDGSVEKVVERRQRRMIKNRESAARSRARKQAYTVELEEEVTRLKEENARLLKQQEEMSERRKKQILDTMVPVTQQLAPKEQVLRRTRSMPW